MLPYNCRYNSSLDEYRLEDDSDERARIRRAIEIQEGIEIDQVASNDLIESLNSRTSDELQQSEHCKRCQQNELQYRQLHQALLSITDDETNPKYHSQVDYKSHKVNFYQILLMFFPPSIYTFRLHIATI